MTHAITNVIEGESVLPSDRDILKLHFFELYKAVMQNVAVSPMSGKYETASLERFHLVGPLFYFTRAVLSHLWRES